MAERAKMSMSEEHKEALALGRAEGRAVRAYLEALESYRPKRGRRRTAESISARRSMIADELGSADPLKRLQLTQEDLDLANELAEMDDGPELESLETEFVSVAKSYATRKRISYAAFREVGVPAEVLRKAEVTRSAS
jgi:hypothetical protein